MTLGQSSEVREEGAGEMGGRKHTTQRSSRGEGPGVGGTQQEGEMNGEDGQGGPRQWPVPSGLYFKDEQLQERVLPSPGYS